MPIKILILCSYLHGQDTVFDNADFSLLLFSSYRLDSAIVFNSCCLPESYVGVITRFFYSTACRSVILLCCCNLLSTYVLEMVC